MIESPIDGSAVNQGSYIGKNWLGSGGFTADQEFDAQIQTHIKLQGGCEAAPALGGNVEARLVGGIITSSFIGCNWHISPKLNGGMLTTEDNGGKIYVWPKLLGGYHKTSGVGGGLKTDMKLKSNYPLWSNSDVAGFIFISGRVLSNGLSSNSEVFADRTKSLCALFSGIKTSSDVGGDLLTNHTRIYLRGGNYTTSLVSGKFKNTIKLAPKTGIYSLNEVGGVGKVMPRTTYGVMSANTVGFTPIHCGRALNGGIESAQILNASFKISFAANYGAYSTETVGSNYIISPVLTPIVIVYKRSKCDSEPLRISPHMNDGAESTSFTSSKYVVSAILPDGFMGSDSIGGQIRTTVLLQGNFTQQNWLDGFLKVTLYLRGSVESKGYTLNAKLVSAPKLSGGDSTFDLVSAKFITSISLSGGLGSNYSFIDLFHDTSLSINAVLRGGHESNSFMLGKLNVSPKLYGGIMELYELHASYKLSPSFKFASFSNQRNGGQLRIQPMLHGAVSSVEVFSAKIVVSPRLSFAVKSSALLMAKYFTTIKLVQGISSLSKFHLNLQSNPMLQSGLHSNGQNQGKQNISAMLQNGVLSISIVRGELAASFKDPNLNSWAIYLKSATQQLSIKTPLQDT